MKVDAAKFWRDAYFNIYKERSAQINIICRAARAVIKDKTDWFNFISMSEYALSNHHYFQSSWNEVQMKENGYGRIN